MYAWSAYQSLFFVGACIGALVSHRLADDYGRRPTLLLNGCVCVCALLPVLLSGGPEPVSLRRMFGSRIAMGIVAGCGQSVQAVYLTEVRQCRWQQCTHRMSVS